MPVVACATMAMTQTATSARQCRQQAAAAWGREGAAASPPLAAHASDHLALCNPCRRRARPRSSLGETRARAGATEQLLLALAAAVAVSTQLPLPAARAVLGEFVLDYFNWSRYAMEPRPPARPKTPAPARAA